jgi:leucyl aminopeptidase (aminopeptidase T)
MEGAAMSVKALRKLKVVCKKLVKNSLLLKPKERMFIALYYPTERIENILDAHLFAYNLVEAARNIGAEANLVTLQSRLKPTIPADGVYNLLRTTWGFLYTPISNSVYGRFRAFINELKKQLRMKGASTDWLRPPDVFFNIAGSRFTGSDVVAASLGFPIPNAPEEKWESTIDMLNQFWWTPQSRTDRRKPISRTALTEAMPLETYIRTLSVDYRAVAKLNAKLKKLLGEASLVRVTGRPTDVNGHQLGTDLKINIEGRSALTDDGKFTGGDDTFINLPGGEVFITPNNADGVLIVDGTVALDKSYPLKHPLAVKFRDGKFSLSQVLCSDKLLIQRIHQTIEGHIKNLRKIKKMKSVSPKTIRLYEQNFYHVGELGIGTNPKARVSPFLVESEKAFGTIHMALGSGYEPEAKTIHHEDMVTGWRTPLTVEALIDGKPVKILTNGKLVLT